LNGPPAYCPPESGGRPPVRQAARGPHKRFFVLLLILLLSVPLLAHHGTGGIYDMSKSVTLKGTVTIFKFVNPHVLVYFDVPGKAGNVGWLGEGPPVINWTRLGWNRNSIKAGDPVTVTLYPARNGKPEGVIAKMVAANGKEWCCETK
jgi:Family of unknown function (DUF6152)